MTKFLKNADVTGYISQTSVTSSLLKTDANGKLVAAVAGTDYNAPNVTAVAGTLIREVRNTTGATLTKGTVVYISGATGNKATVSKAIATGDSTSAQTFGLCQTDIANNSNGNVVCVGDITGLDTSTFTEGVQLYLSSTTAGTYTSTKQLAPAHLVYVGIVTRSHPTLGQIEVKIQNGYELDEIHDVSISSLANNHTLVWESATSLWKNKTIAAALGYTPANGANYLPLVGGTLTGDLTLSGTNPRLYFTDTDNNPDYFISNTDGTFTVYDVTNSVGRFKIYTTGNSEFTSNLAVNGGTVNTSTYTSSEARLADGSVHLMKTSAAGIFEAIRAMNLDTTVGTTVRLVAAATSDPFNNTNGGKVFIDAVRTSTNMDLVFSLNDVAGAAPVERVRFSGSGNVTAVSFIKSGGTSAQFLKADGSVDSSTYLTSYTETDTLSSILTRGNSSSLGATFGTAANSLYTGPSGFVRINTNTVNPGDARNSQSTALLLTNYGSDLGVDGTVDIDFVTIDANSVVGSYPHARIGYTGYYNGLVNSSPDGEARGYFRIATRGEGSAGVLADRFLIDHLGNTMVLTGNTLLGTTTDSGYKLDVNGTGRFTGNVAINGTIIGTDTTFGGAYRTFAFGGNSNGYNRIFAANDASDGLYLNAATGQGINFRVNGGGSNVFSMSSTGAATFSSSVTATDLNVNRGGGAWQIIPSSGESALYFKESTTGNIRMTIQGGNVGIGTTSPSSSVKLEVYDSSANGDIALFSSAATKADIWLKDTNTTAGNVRLRSETNAMVMIAGNNERKRITSTGQMQYPNTGNQTSVVTYTSNQDKGITYFYQAQNFPASNNYTRVFDIISSGDATGGGAIRFLTSAANTAPAATMYLSPAGNVGVGTTSPGETLTVNGSIGLQKTGTQIWHVNVDASNNLSFVRSGIATRAIITSDGQLKLNTYQTATSWSGTAAGYLAFDSSGNVITVGSVASTDSTKLPLAGGTMTGLLAFSNVTGNKIDFYHTTTSPGDRYGIQVQNSELRIHSGAGGDASGGITFGKSTTTTFTEVMRVRNDGIVNIAGLLRTSGATSNTVLFNSGASSETFGNILGAASTYRSTMFRGSTTNSSVWWGGVDANGANIPFAAIDATAGEFAFWRNSGGTGGGGWTKIMTMNDSGLTMNSGNFVGNIIGQWSGLNFNGTTTRFTGDVNTLGLSGTSGIYNLGVATNAPSTYGTLLGFWNTDISTQVYFSYNGNAYWRPSSSTSYSGVAWRTIWDSVSLTNLNQLTNGPGYITGYTETDTFGTVVSRGSTASTGTSYGVTITHTYSQTSLFHNTLFLKANNSGAELGASIGFSVVNAGGDHHRAVIRATGVSNGVGGQFAIYTRRNSDAENIRGYYQDDVGNVRLDNYVGVGQDPNTGYRFIVSGSMYLNANGNGWAEGTFKQRRGGSTFYDVLDTASYSSYALPLSGGTMSGAITNTSASSRFGNLLIGQGTYKNSIQPIDDVNMNLSTPSGAVYVSNTLYINGTNVALHAGNYTSYSSFSGLSASGFLSATGGSKIVVQNGSNGGSDRGIFMWTSSDPNWAIYMATGGTTSIAGGTTCNALDGSGSHSLRSRIYLGASNSFIWENSAEVCLMSLGADVAGNGLFVKRRIRNNGGYTLSGDFGFYTSYTSDGLWGGTATPNSIGTTSNGGRLILGYQDNGNGLYSPAYGFEVRSTDGRPVGGQVVRAIVMKDVDTGAQPFIVYNNGGIYSANNIQASKFLVNGDSWIVFNNEEGAWGIKTRTTTNTGNLGAALKNIFYCGGGSNEGFAVMGSGTGNASFEVKNDGTAWIKGSLTAGGDVTAYSDVRIKTDIKTLTNALNTVISLRGVSYKRTDNGDAATKIGVIAQETQAVLPEVVQEQPDGMLSVSYGNMAGIFIEAIKEQQSHIESQQLEIEELKGLVKQLLAK
jgi:hypothetical protein